MGTPTCLLSTEFHRLPTCRETVHRSQCPNQAADILASGLLIAIPTGSRTTMEEQKPEVIIARFASFRTNYMVLAYSRSEDRFKKENNPSGLRSYPCWIWTFSFWSSQVTQFSTFSASYDTARPMKPLPRFIHVSVVVAKSLSARSGDYPPGSTFTSHLQAEKAGDFSQYTAYHHAQGRHACRKPVRIAS